MDVDDIATIVRVTARVSGALFVVGLLASPVADARRLFLTAFAIAHAIHFGCVAAFTQMTGGTNLEARGGPVVAAITLVIFVLAGGALVIGLRRGPGWAVAVPVGLFSLGFGKAWAERVVDTPAYAVPLVLLAAGLGLAARSALATARRFP